MNPDVSEIGEVLNFYGVFYQRDISAIREILEIVDYTEYDSIFPLSMQEPRT